MFSEEILATDGTRGNTDNEVVNRQQGKKSFLTAKYAEYTKREGDFEIWRG